MITSVAANGPAFGRLQVGDEIVRVQTPQWTREAAEYSSQNLYFSAGPVGEPVKMTVRRDGELLEFDLARSRIEGFEMVIDEDMAQNFQRYVQEEMPDFKVEVNLIIEEGDKVAIIATQSGTSQKFHASAVWRWSGIWRLENGKIVETWGVEDELNCNLQLGFRLEQPAT